MAYAFQLLKRLQSVDIKDELARSVHGGAEAGDGVKSYVSSSRRKKPATRRTGWQLSVLNKLVRTLKDKTGL